MVVGATIGKPVRNENKLSIRHQKIIRQLRQDGIVYVDALSSALFVSPITVRRDLEFLQSQGWLERIHGGALPLKDQHLELPYKKREKLQAEKKEAIGKRAAQLIDDHSIIFLNSGSTSLEVFRHLLYRQVQVITNNPDCVQLMAAANSPPILDLMIIGGHYRYQSHSLSGDVALAAIQDTYSLYTVLSVNGIHPKYGVTCSWQQHVGLNREMVSRCRGKVIVVADSSKIDAVSNFVCLRISAIDILVTDTALNKNSKKRFEDVGLQVITA